MARTGRGKGAKDKARRDWEREACLCHCRLFTSSVHPSVRSCICSTLNQPSIGRPEWTYSTPHSVATSDGLISQEIRKIDQDAIVWWFTSKLLSSSHHWKEPKASRQQVKPTHHQLEKVSVFFYYIFVLFFVHSTPMRHQKEKKCTKLQEGKRMRQVQLNLVSVYIVKW